MPDMTMLSSAREFSRNSFLQAPVAPGSAIPFFAAAGVGLYRAPTTYLRAALGAVA